MVNLSRLISDMADLLRRTLGESIEVETVVAGGLWNTIADPAQVESALLNLALNARDAMPERRAPDGGDHQRGRSTRPMPATRPRRRRRAST